MNLVYLMKWIKKIVSDGSQMSKLRLVESEEGVSCEELLRWCDTCGNQMSNFGLSPQLPL